MSEDEKTRSLGKLAQEYAGVKQELAVLTSELRRAAQYYRHLSGSIEKVVGRDSIADSAHSDALSGEPPAFDRVSKLKQDFIDRTAALERLAELLRDSGVDVPVRAK